MKFLITTLLAFTSIHSLYCQDITRIIETDSSIIKTKLYGYTGRDSNIIYTGKTIDEYIKGKNLVRETSYFFRDTTNIESISYTDTGLRKKLGISRIFDEQGQLIMTKNYDNRTWTPVDTAKYPNYTFLNRMKLKGDSIIKAIYGEAFFNNCVKWNFDSHYFDQSYFDERPIEWQADNKEHNHYATEFAMQYDLCYDGGIYEKAIQIIINREGQLLPRHSWTERSTIYNEGLDSEASKLQNAFKLTIAEAIKLAQQFGLNNRDSTKVEAHLLFDPIKDSSAAIFNGHFRIYVYEQLPKVTGKKKKKKEMSQHYIRHYNVWVFNPWNKELVCKKTMHRKFWTWQFVMSVGLLEDD